MEKQPTILIVDDEPGAQILISEMLSRDYTVKTAGSSDQALTLLEQEEINIIISDIRMPGKDGLSLLAEVRNLYPDIIVILITGHGDKETIISAIRSGAFDYLEKPFKEDDLLITTERAVKEHNLIERLKQAEVKYMEAFKSSSIGVITAGVANEISGPLASVKANFERLVGFIKDKNLFSPEINEHFTRNQKALEQISSVVKHLKNHTSLEGETLTPFNLHQLISETLQAFKPLYRKGHVEVVENLEAEFQNVKIHLRSFQIILTNILTNAFESMIDKGKGKIQVATSNQDKKFVLKVSDQGHGICEEHLDQVFTPFFSGKQGEKRLGLGLSISLSLVKNMEGDIQIESEPQKGTVVSLSLPYLATESDTAN